MKSVSQSNPVARVILLGGTVALVLQGIFLAAISTKFWRSADLLTAVGWLAFTPGMLFAVANLAAAACFRKGRIWHVLLCACFSLALCALPKAAYRQQRLRDDWFVTVGIVEHEALRTRILGEPRLLGSVRARVRLDDDPARLAFGSTNADGSASLEFYGPGHLVGKRSGYLFHTGPIEKYRYRGVRSFRAVTNNWYEFN